MAIPIQVVVDDGLSLNPGAAPVTSSLLSVSSPADPHADDDIIYPYAFSRIASHHLSHQMQLSQDCLTLDPKPEFAWPQIQSQGYAWARSKEGIRPNAGIVRWQVRLNKTSATNQEDFWVGVATVTATLASLISVRRKCGYLETTKLTRTATSLKTTILLAAMWLRWSSSGALDSKLPRLQLTRCAFALMASQEWRWQICLRELCFSRCFTSPVDAVTRSFPLKKTLHRPLVQTLKLRLQSQPALYLILLMLAITTFPN